MGNNLAEGIIELKRRLVESYEGNSPLYEAIPAESCESLRIEEHDLEALHGFARSNPLYSRSHKTCIEGMHCVVYEGDPNGPWLDSLKHDASYAPFYTTWILSAYALAREAYGMGLRQAIDVGSGDGRIAYCCRLLGMRSLGIEIDGGLVETQRSIASRTGVEFESVMDDATRFDYSALPPDPASFFISGLPEVGEILADGVVSKASSGLRTRTTFVLTGTGTARGSRYGDLWGWSNLIHSYKLTVESTLVLPTRWTMDQPSETPYVFASLTRHTTNEVADRATPPPKGKAVIGSCSP